LAAKRPIKLDEQKKNPKRPQKSKAVFTATHRCSAFNAVSLVPVLDRHHQIPLLVHRDRVGEQRVEDLDAEQRGQVEVGEADESDSGGLANADERGPGRGREQLGKACACVGPVKRADADWQRVAVELRENLSAGDDRTATAHVNPGRRRQPIQRERQPLEPVVLELCGTSDG